MKSADKEEEEKNLYLCDGCSHNIPRSRLLQCDTVLFLINNPIIMKITVRLLTYLSLIM